MSESSSLLTPPVIAALGIGVLAVYYLWKSSNNDHHQSQNEQLAPEPEKMERLPVGRLSVSEIADYDGKDKSRILVSVCGRIFDLTKSRDFYGPDGPYHCFAGADATYMLGAMSTDKKGRNKKGIKQDGDHQITLSDWISRFRGKYPIVGRLEGYESLCPESWREAGNDDVIDDSLDINTIYDQSFKTVNVSELKDTIKYDNDNTWIAVCGIVFDIKSADTVYEHMYGDFPKAVGYDISVALATDTFNEEVYDQPISEISGDMQKLVKLKTLLSRFMETYPVVGYLGENGGKFKMDMDNVSEDWNVVNQGDAQ